MPVQCNTVLYPVKDLDKAKALFATLFGDPHVDSSYYVGFSVDGDEIGLVPNGHDQGMTGPVPFFDVEDLSTTLAALQAVGAQVAQEPTDVGRRTARRQGERRRRQRHRPAAAAHWRLAVRATAPWPRWPDRVGRGRPRQARRPSQPRTGQDCAVVVPGTSVPHVGVLEVATNPLWSARMYQLHWWGRSCPKIVE